MRWKCFNDDKESTRTERSNDKAPARSGSSDYQPDSYSVDHNDVGVLDLLSVISRRRFLIGTIVAIGTALAALYGFPRIPVYTSEAQLLFETEQRVVDFDNVVAGVSSDTSAIATQINLLSSNHILNELALRLTLTDLAFSLNENDSAGTSKAAAPEEAVKIFGISLPSGIAEAYGLTEEPKKNFSGEAADSTIQEKSKELLEGLKITQKGLSSVISITYIRSTQLDGESKRHIHLSWDG